MSKFMTRSCIFSVDKNGEIISSKSDGESLIEDSRLVVSEFNVGEDHYKISHNVNRQITEESGTFDAVVNDLKKIAEQNELYACRLRGYPQGSILGAIAGDVIGSRFEHDPFKSTEFNVIHRDCFFTDDSVLTVALAETLLEGGDADAYAVKMRDYYQRYPDAGYGGNYHDWAQTDMGPYNSWGNGSAMRTSPVGWWYPTLEDTLEAAEAFAAVTHNHLEGIKGAQATAAAIFMARNGRTKWDIARYIELKFDYDLSPTVEEIRPDYAFDVSCAGTVPEAIICFLYSNGINDAIKLSISLGGDADTLACISGSIASAYYGTSEETDDWVMEQLDPELRSVVTRFNAAVVDSNDY
ncbi:ADP-ribosylglycohydrolase family protein [Pseudomonadota bacterium]